MNVFQYAATAEANFERMYQEIGHERITTFYSDLSIGEWYGRKGINDTYRLVMKSWIDNIEFITEFCICLNWKAWQWASEWNPLNFSEESRYILVELYSNLHNKCKNAILKHYKKDEKALNYFLKMID